MYSEIGHKSGQAWTGGKLGNVHWARGEYLLARRSYEDCLRIFDDLGDREGIAWSLNSLGHARLALGEHDAARAFYRKGLEVYRSLGHAWGTAWSEANLGNLLVLQGETEDGQRLLEKARDAFQAMGNPWGAATALDGLGRAAARNRPLEARRLLEEALAVFRVTGHPRETALTLCRLGRLEDSAGSSAEAAGRYAEALRTARDIRTVPVFLHALTHVGSLESRSGKPEEGILKCLYVLDHPAADAQTRSLAEEAAGRAAPSLPDGRFESLREKARVLRESGGLDWALPDEGS